MPKFKYALTNGKTLVLEGNTQPSDADVEAHAHDAGVELQPAQTIAERNADARANMAKQHEGAPSLVSEFVKGAKDSTMYRVGPGRAVLGFRELATPGQRMKGAHDVIGGAGTTLAAATLPAALVAAPIPTALALAGGALGNVVGTEGAKQLGASDDAANLVGDVTGFAGGSAGAKVGNAIPVAPVLRFMGGELARPGGVQGVVGRGIAATADAADEVAARARGPVTRILQPSPERQAEQAFSKRAELTKAAKLEADAKAKLEAEARATNKNRDPHDQVRAQVTPVGDTMSSRPTAVMPDGRVPYNIPPEPQVAPNPHDAVTDSVVPLADDSARSLHTMSAPDVVTRSYGGYRDALPNMFDGPEAATEISHPGAQDYINREYAANHAHALDVLGDQVRVPADFRAVDSAGAPIDATDVARATDSQPVASTTPARGVEATLTSDERALFGNRGASAVQNLTIAQRKLLFDAMVKKALAKP